MSKPQPIDKPTRRTVEQLFRELQNSPRSVAANNAYQQAREECEALEERLLSAKRYKDLCAKRDRLYQRMHDLTEKRRESLRVVRMQYLACGLTPKVEAAIKRLVESSE